MKLVPPRGGAQETRADKPFRRLRDDSAQKSCSPRGAPIVPSPDGFSH
jgi:hypothetical protein